MGKDLEIGLAGYRDNEFTHLSRLENLCAENRMQGLKELGAMLGKMKLNLSKRRRDFILELKEIMEIWITP